MLRDDRAETKGAIRRCCRSLRRCPLRGTRQRRESHRNEASVLGEPAALTGIAAAVAELAVPKPTAIAPAVILSTNSPACCVALVRVASWWIGAEKSQCPPLPEAPVLAESVL